MQRSPSAAVLNAQTSFNDRGNGNLNVGGNYDYNLKGDFGVKVRLHGWSHTRTYAQGFLRNQPGNPTATVSGLKPNQGYTYRIYQTDTGGYSRSRPQPVCTAARPSPATTGCTTATSS